MNFAKKYFVGCTAIVMALSTVGCETLTSDPGANKKKKKDSSWFSFKKREYQTPQSMNVTWSHDILTLPGKAATRGFGGRFYFYNEKTQAIPVEGDLVVYGFDDTNKQKSTEDLNQATKRFRFTAEQFTTHFSEGELGASYSVWIPWDEAYGAPKKIMLIPTFLTKEGRMVRGAAANLNLPGNSNEDQNESVIQQASSPIPIFSPMKQGDLSRNGTLHEAGGLKTTTIQVPSNSLIRRSQHQEQLPSLTELQSQQLAVASNAVASQFGPITTVASGLNNSLNATQPQNSIDPSPQNTGLKSNANFAQPIQMPLMQNNVMTKNVNGWALPEYAPMTYPALSPRSVSSQFQAPTSQGVQPSAYPTR